MRRLVAALTSLLLGLTLMTLAVPTAQAAGRTYHVSPSASAGGDGSASSPFRTIAAALAKAGNGDTIELANGTYREGNLYVRKAVAIRAASGAHPVISGATPVSGWAASGNGTWSVGNQVRYCTVCTADADPTKEGMAAHPEQVFVDGSPLTQVGSRSAVTASSFYVADSDPVTLKSAHNNRAGYNVKPHRGTTYVIGVDPSKHRVEIVQYARALTVAANGASINGVIVEKYSPVQQSDYKDPEIGNATGSSMVTISGTNTTVTNSTFRYSAAGPALSVSNATSTTLRNDSFVDNGGNGLGAFQSSGITVERSSFTGNNSAGFVSASCGAYCVVADTKIVRSTDVRYAYNTVDYSDAGVDYAHPDVFANERRAAVWFDEGVINSQVVGNYFVNNPVAVLDEVSKGDVIASNLIEGAGVGIHVAGSEDTRIWNNTVSHALTSVIIREDDRTDACQSRDSAKRCTSYETWSKNHGLTWNVHGTELYNNILSSEEMATSGDVYAYSPMLQVVGATNDDGVTQVWANRMIYGIDYNVYYRAKASTTSTAILWRSGPNRGTDGINAVHLSDFRNSPVVQTRGEELHGLELLGTRAANPIFMRESANPRAWKTSDFHLSASSPAHAKGAKLPDDIASMLGVPAVEGDRGVLVNAAW